MLLSWAALALVAACAAIVVGASVAVAACVVVLAAAAATFGWQFGEGKRVVLEDDIKGRSTQLKRALSELEIAQAETVRRLSMAVEFRDEDTGAHIERIGRFSTLLAEHIGMDPEFCERLKHAAPLHDVGKVAIPDAILYKPSSLDDDERALMSRHPVIGAEIVSGIEFLTDAAEVVRSHHERWDGTGYPDRLAGEDIPLAARAFSVADVLDALTTDRPYRPAFPMNDARSMINAERGTHFDPRVVDAFNSIDDDVFERIAAEIR
jgi:response regulator RpfG family c-di-GMP phosphodiesterase